MGVGEFGTTSNRKTGVSVSLAMALTLTLWPLFPEMETLRGKSGPVKICPKVLTYCVCKIYFFWIHRTSWRPSFLAIPRIWLRCLFMSECPLCMKCMLMKLLVAFSWMCFHCVWNVCWWSYWSPFLGLCPLCMKCRWSYWSVQSNFYGSLYLPSVRSVEWSCCSCCCWQSIVKSVLRSFSLTSISGQTDHVCRTHMGKGNISRRTSN
jgi:hypothetical protein